ncbi:MAG: sirohydrochlorin chelatase [Actinomycetota bacterium]|nr:sirohydrochlorin chelatase [Actinomycetota bacterium]
MADRPALLLVGHGSRSPAGVAEYWELARVVTDAAPELDVGCGFIELAAPDLDTAVDRLVERGAASVVAVPLVLLGAGHMKDDGPAALHRGRHRHPSVPFAYARHLGLHPLVLAVAEDRIRAAVAAGDPAETAVVVVGRGSSDPDANADLYKAARLLWDSRGLLMVEPAFVSLAPPGVPAALERCRLLGATRIVVVPYFLFTGVLVDRIEAQVAAWSASHRGVDARTGPHLGADPRIARLVLDRYREALAGGAHMNCDLCVYRHPLPGYEHRHHHHGEGVIHLGDSH